MMPDNRYNLQPPGKKTLLFAAGDVGGARALSPVIQECAARGIPFGVISHGYMANEANPDWPMVVPPDESDGRSMSELLDNLMVGAFAFGSSVNDTFALTMARLAGNKNIPLFHILDNWTAYRHRLENDGQALLHPDVYTVMDHLAYTEAVAEGIDPVTLKVTGQPALAALCSEIEQFRQNKTQSAARCRIVFVSEPVFADQKGNTASPFFRGYTESQVLQSLCRALQPHAQKVTLSLLPHPREDADQLRRTWETAKGELKGEVTDGTNGRDHILRSDGVAGMASLLLYEAWLVGKPVLSIQPGLRRNDLRMLSQRKEIIFVDTQEGIENAVDNWLSNLQATYQRNPHPDIMRHRESAATICSLLKEKMTATGSITGCDNAKKRNWL